jgi:hypothetical protein
LCTCSVIIVVAIVNVVIQISVGCGVIIYERIVVYRSRRSGDSVGIIGRRRVDVIVGETRSRTVKRVGIWWTQRIG